MPVTHKPEFFLISANDLQANNKFIAMCKHILETITLNHAENYLEMLNQLTAANFYLTEEGEAIFYSHDTISSVDISTNKYFLMITNRVVDFFDKVNIAYTIERQINTLVEYVRVKNILKYQQPIEEAYRQPLNWYDEDEIKDIMKKEIANRSGADVLSDTGGLILPLMSKQDSKYLERSSDPRFLYDKKKTYPISAYHFARRKCKCM